MLTNNNIFDPKKLTDKELFDKQLDLIQKRMLSERMGKIDVSEQIKIFIQAIEFERRERMFTSHIGAYMRNTAGTVIESDPDLAIKNIKNEDSADTKPEPTNTNRRRPVRTLSPTKNKNQEN